MDFFSRYSLPRELQSDRGIDSTSRCFQEKFHELGIKHVMSIPYHPESQAILEQFHSTSKNTITKYTSHNPNKWEEDIPFVLFASQSAPSVSLGFSPYEMIYGHNVRGPLDILTPKHRMGFINPL